MNTFPYNSNASLDPAIFGPAFSQNGAVVRRDDSAHYNYTPAPVPVIEVVLTDDAGTVVLTDDSGTVVLTP